MSRTVIKINFVVYFELRSVNNNILNAIRRNTIDIKNPILSIFTGYIFNVFVKNV